MEAFFFHFPPIQNRELPDEKTTAGTRRVGILHWIENVRTPSKSGQPMREEETIEFSAAAFLSGPPLQAQRGEHD